MFHMIAQKSQIGHPVAVPGGSHLASPIGPIVDVCHTYSLLGSNMAATGVPLAIHHHKHLYQRVIQIKNSLWPFKSLCGETITCSPYSIHPALHAGSTRIRRGLRSKNKEINVERQRRREEHERESIADSVKKKALADRGPGMEMMGYFFWVYKITKYGVG